MAVRTSTQAGPWNSTATWGGSAVPGDGDQVVIGHAVDVTANQTVGTSGAATVRAIELALNGSLTIKEDIILICKGKLHATDTSTITMEQGSKWRWCTVPVGLVYELKHYNGLFAINGTAAKRCEFSTNAGGGIAHIPLWNAYEAPIQFDYCDFIRVGDATNFAIHGVNPSATGKFVVRHCTFTDCGEVYHDSQVATKEFRYEDNRHYNSLGAFPLTISGGVAKTSGTFSVKGNTFDLPVKIVSPQDHTITDNFFDTGSDLLLNGPILPAGTAWSGCVFQRNTLRKSITSDVNWKFPSTVDMYLIEDHTTSNPHPLSPNAGWSQVLDGVVFEYSGTDGQGDCITQAPSSGFTLDIINCIVTLNANGANRMGVLHAMGGFPGTVIKSRHNTFWAGLEPGVAVGEASGGLDYAGQFGEYKSNLCCAVPGQTGRFAISDVGLAATNILPTASATHNCHGPGIAAGSAGKGYNYTVSGGSPGANDLALGTDPSFVDSTRRLSKWDLSLGGPGTTLAALNRLRANPYLVADALEYVREGYRPQNAALATAGHDGQTIGAVPYSAVDPGDNPPGRAQYIQNMLDMLTPDGPMEWYAENPLSSPTAQPGNDHHYNHDTPDAFRMALQYHPGNADLQDMLDIAVQGYVNYINHATATVGGVGDPYGHARGLFKLWEQNGDTVARDAALKVRDFGAGIASGSGIWAIGNRPVAYSIEDFIQAHRLGLRPLDEPYWSNTRTWSIGHVASWLGDPYVWAAQNQTYFPGLTLEEQFMQHFMMGLTGHALAAAHEYIYDVLGGTDDRILPALVHLAAMLRWRHWKPTWGTTWPGGSHPGSFVWSIYPTGEESPSDEEGPGDWANMIVSQFFAYLWKRTGCVAFRDWGDEALYAATDSGSIHSPKEYAEYFRYVDDWDRWRQSSPGSDNNYLVAVPPFRPYTSPGVASEPIKIMPLKNATGTVTISDGDGWTTTVSWSGDAVEKEFTYTPTSPGDKTLTFSNDMGMVNPWDQGWVIDPGDGPTPVADYTLDGPSSGALNVASSNFTVTLGDGEVTGTITFIPQSSGGTQTFSPASLALTNSSKVGTFTVTPTSSGSRIISVTNNGGLPEEPGVTFDVSSTPVTGYTFTGPSGGTIGTQSSQFTVTLGAGNVASPITFTPTKSAGTGTFVPTFLVLSNSTRSDTFRHIPADATVRNIGVTNDAGLANQAAITFTPTQPDPGPPSIDWSSSVMVLPGAPGERILIIPWDGTK